MTATALDVERTSRDTTIAQWSVAGIVMAGSAAAGGFAFNLLGEHWTLGVLTGLAVDMALALWLRIAKRLRTTGLRSPAGVVLELTTATFTLYLNLGAAVFRGIDPRSVLAHWLLGVAHSFLPVLLVLVTVAFGDAQFKLQKLRRDQEVAEQVARDAQLVAERAEFERQQRERREIEERRANGEFVTARDTLAEAQRLRALAQTEADETTRLREVTERERDAAEAAVTATRAAAEKLAQRPRKPTASSPPRIKRRDTSPEARKQWIREQRAAGHNPTGADVDREFGPPKTGWRLVKQVEEEIAAELAEIAQGEGVAR